MHDTLGTESDGPAHIGTECVALNRAGIVNSTYPGRRFAAVAASLCPGLVC